MGLFQKSRGAGCFRIETDLPPDQVRAALEKWQPWRMEIAFSNGVKTSDLETCEPFNPFPLFKLRVIEQHLQLETLAGGDALDVGFNCGYNSIHLANEYRMRVTSIDHLPRHKEVAEYLGSLVGAGDRIEWLLEDAMSFQRPDAFDLVLHLGTLYHLPNPLASLEHSIRSLRQGGRFALETLVSSHEDPALCRFIRGLGGDRSNFWALSPAVLDEMMTVYGLTDMRIIRNEVPPGCEKLKLSRLILIGKKAPKPGRARPRDTRLSRRDAGGA